MVKLNSSDSTRDESVNQEDSKDLTDQFHNLIWTMKAVDYMNKENQENLSRVHVLCCKKCDFLTISLKALQQHMEFLHSVLTEDFNNFIIYSCHECKCVSTELKIIEEHIKIFHNFLVEKSPTSSTSDKVSKNMTILASSATRINRKPTHIALMKSQLKMRKKMFQRKSQKIKLNHFLSNDPKVEQNNNISVDAINLRIKEEKFQYNGKMEIKQDVNENDPLDMSINSTMCPFKGKMQESIKPEMQQYSMKHDSILTENQDNVTFNNSIVNNPLLSNPQTCIELIKLTLGQMLNKTTEQNRLSNLGFNPSSFLQSQFQLPPNIVPLLLPTMPQVQNGGQNQLQNDMPFISNNPQIEAILSNLQQQNIMKGVSSHSFDQNHQILNLQQPPIYQNHNVSGSSFSVSNNRFVDNVNTAFNTKKLNDFPPKSPIKRSLKKQPLPSKVRTCVTDEFSYPQSIKFEPTSTENLFNRSFLDTNDMDTTNDQLKLSRGLEDHDQSESQHVHHSNKSSPNAMSNNEKPHRQNFTSQQNRILADWFLIHCEKPYPSTEDTKELSQLSGLTYSQVKKWFANKRARSSLNKKSHKGYSLMASTGSAVEEMGNDDAQSVSPSSESHKSYGNPTDANTDIEFTICKQEQSREN